MADFLLALRQNAVLVSAVTAWFAAQLLKVLLSFRSDRGFQAERLLGAGGMPSSHTALVVGLTSSIGFSEGVHSSMFALAVVVAGIVMYDAAGIRNAAGNQAKVINTLIRQGSVEHTFPHLKGIKLKELLGHTPLEVLAGAALGFIMAWAFSGFHS